MVNEVAVFEPLPLRRRVMIPVSAEAYQVVSPRGEIKEVVASSAYEAFRRSGIRSASKIVRTVLVRKPVLPQQRFAAVAHQDIASGAGAIIDDSQIYRPRRSVVTAQEMEQIMPFAEDAVEENPSLPEPVIDELPSVAEAVAPPVPHANGGVELPSTPLEQLQQVATPTGVEVHGDGFDEIIPTPFVPAKPAVKAQAVEPVLPPPVDSAPLSAVEMPPEQELTQDEIDKLLKG